MAGSQKENLIVLFEWNTRKGSYPDRVGAFHMVRTKRGEKRQESVDLHGALG